MRAGIESMDGWPGFILLGYDDVDASALPLDEWSGIVNETFVTGEPKGRLGHAGGELAQMRRGAELLAERGFRYVFKHSADVAVYDHSGIAKTIEFAEREKIDLVTEGTAVVIGRMAPFYAVMRDYYPGHPNFRSRVAEGYFGRQARDMEVTTLKKGKRWWADQLMRVHIQGRWARNQGVGVKHSWLVGEIWPRDEGETRG
jgi:hypothetical protein